MPNTPSLLPLTARFDVRRATVPAAVLFSLITGCSEPAARPTQETKPEFELDTAALQAALEEPIQSCQEQRTVCRDEAENADDRAACNDSLITCLDAAADRAERIAAAVRECRDEAEACVEDDRELDVCRDTYESCTETALRGDGEDDQDADAGTAEPTVDAGGSDEDEDEGDGGRASRPGRGNALPGLPSVDGGIVDRLPKPLRCVVQLRLCVAADRGAASECADTARMCLRED